MSKRTKFLASIMATVLFAGTLAGCGSSAESGDKGDKGEKKELVVWSHLNEPEVEELDKLAQKWGEENNVNVTMTADKSSFQAYQEAVNSEAGPDLMFGMAHDSLGKFQAGGCLAELPSGMIDESKYTSEHIADAVKVDGKACALPIAAETTALYYNTDKVKEAPKTMEDVIKDAKTKEKDDKEKGFKIDITTPYISYAFLAANGAYVFKDNNGTLDPKDIGLNNEGAVKGYQMLSDMVLKDKLMPADINGDLAKGEFIAGNSAYYISGPWDIEAFKEAGVNFAVAPLPTIEGKETPSFMGVQAAFVSANSKEKDLAWKLAKYLADNSTDVLLDKGTRLPITNEALESDKMKNNENLKGFVEQTKQAVPMPNIPEVQAIWNPIIDNLKLLIAGKQDAKQCADKTVEQINEGIAQQK